MKTALKVISIIQLVFTGFGLLDGLDNAENFAYGLGVFIGAGFFAALPIITLIHIKKTNPNQ